MIIIGSDHGGYKLKEQIKEYLTSKSYDFVDVGAYSVDENDDFSFFTKEIIKKYNKDTTSKIIALCGSGIGVNIALNKAKGIFCAVGHNVKEVELARQHNNINAITFGGRTTEFDNAIEMIDTFLKTDFIGGKYQRRMNDIDL